MHNQNEETVVLDGTDGCRSVCLQTSEGWRFSGSNRMSKRLIVNKGIVTIMATAKYDDWPCFLEIMRSELTALIFVTTRPLPSKL